MTDKTVDMPPIGITMIGTGPGTNMTGMTAVTPKGSPNFIVESVVTPAFAVLIRFLHLYFVTLVGLVTAALTPLGSNTIAYTDFWSLVVSCATLSVAGPALGAGKDLITIFGRLEGKFPLLTGNI